MSIETVPFTEYFDFAPKSKRKSGDGLEEGAYPFFVSSQTLIKRTNEPDYEGEALVFGTGGNPSVHYISGKFSTSGDCLVAFPKKKKEAARAINYFLRGNIHLLEEGFKGAGLKHISKKYISALGIPDLKKLNLSDVLDPVKIAEQVKVKRLKAIGTLEHLLEALFLNSFNKEEIKNYKIETVENMALDEKGSIRTGPFGSQLLHSEFVEEGVSVLGIDNAVQNKFSWGERRFITEEKYDQLKRYTVRPGDVLITIMGTCGRCAVVPDNIPTSINTKHLCCITLNTKKCLPEFLHSYFLMHPMALQYLKSRSKGAIMDGLNMGIIKDMPVPLVPIEKQQEFVKQKKTIENKIETYQRALNEADLFFKSLTQKAFEGAL
ncbi:MAG: restriction endonuclease subunit S [Alphaproteobacteria bacterium]